jgi:tRNA A-37 threonylcarbamoyl transferase component Bud32
MRIISKIFGPKITLLPTGVRGEFELPSDLTTVQIVKTNRQRTVKRFERNGQRFYMKTCRIDGIRAWFRDLFRGPKARLEFDNARELTARSIAVIEPFAWLGRAWPGESVIVTREVPNAVPLADYLTRHFPALPVDRQRQLRRSLARSLGGYLASLYSAGVIHADPHPGNFLVSFDERGEAAFTLVDVHGLKFVRSFSANAIMDNLVLFNRWFILRTTRADRLRFWTTFRLTLARLSQEDGRTVERRTVESNLNFWARRFGRYRGDNREFRTHRVGPFHGYAARIALPDSILENPDTVLEQSDAVVLKSSRSSKVVSFSADTADGTQRFILKRIPVRSWFSPLKNIFKSSAIVRSWQFGLSLRDRYLPTPRPLVAFHRYRFGFPLEGYLLTEEQCGAVTLDRAVARVVHRADGKRILNRWAERLGRLIRTMHDRGVYHGDLKAANILLKFDEMQPDTVEITLIDLVGVKTSRSVTRKDRIEDLGRLAASFLNSNAITHGVRWRFLATYCSVFPRFLLKFREISAAVERKRRRNESRGRMLG